MRLTSNRKANLTTPNQQKTNSHKESNNILAKLTGYKPMLVLVTALMVASMVIVSSLAHSSAASNNHVAGKKSKTVLFDSLNSSDVKMMANGGATASFGNSYTPSEFFTIGTCDTAGPIEVESTGGTVTPTAYATLTAAFAAINAGTHTGSINIEVCGNTDETTGTALLNASGSGSASYTDISIKPVGGAARTITGATTAGSPMIDFSGADNVTIDGLNTGGNSLTIANTTVSTTSGTSTFRFIGGATGNTITNSNLQGSVSSSVATNGAIVFFSTDAVTANGNDNNTISNNNIGPAGANLPTKGVLCNGSTGTQAIGNSGLIINNNNIFDYFGATVTSAGVAVNGGCNTFSITNNRFYQTATRTWTTGAEHNGILLNSSTSTSGVQGMTITGNIVGYASNTQTGTYTLTGSTGIFRGIRYNGISTGTTSNINNNTVANVSLTGVTSSGTSTSSPFLGMLFNEGNVISNGNTVGSQSATGSMTFSTTTTSSTDVYGIYNFSSNAWTSNNNNVGGISVTNLGASGTFLVYGMRAFTASTTPWTGTSNNVGGTVANSIQLTATGTSSQVVGMFTSNCPLVLTSNTIRNLTTNIGTGTTTTASVVGILNSSTTPNSTLSQNTIFNLTNTNATAASVVTGIQFTGSTANVVERNLIYGITAATNSATAEVNGIRVGGGTTVYRNNMIAVGAGIANAIPVNGINEPSGTDSFFHNSVYVGGSPTAGSGNSFAFNSAVTTNTRSYRDNIFFNARSNSGATGKNYIVRVGGTAPNPAGLTINNNLYFANGTGAVFGLFNALDVADLTAWRTAVGQDTASIFGNPQFNDPTNATPDLHLHPTNATPAEGNGADVGVTNDYDGQTRASLTPTDIGADAGNFNGIDLAAPVITYTAFGNTSSTSNRVLTVTITDVTGVTTGGLAPRIYFNKNGGSYSSTACSLASGTVQNGTWNCTIDYSLLGGVVVTDVIRYFVIAQDTLGNISSNPAGATATDVNTVTAPPAVPNQYTIVNAVSGTISVGTDQTIQSLTNTGGLFEAINSSAVTGNITVNLTTDLTAETGTVSLNQTVEEGAGNYTITIQPSGGVARTISGSNTTALINLNGADRVTFNGLNTGGNSLLIRNTSATTGAVILMVNDASNNTVTNSTIEGGNTSTSSALILIGAGTTTGNDNNTITNNTVRDRTDAAGVPANAIASLNGSATATNSFNNVSNNQVMNFINNGIATSSGATSDNWTINNNDISQTATRGATTFGINTGGMTGTNTISGNSIHGFTSSSTFGVLGFLVGNSLNLTISKNRVYDFQTTAGATGVIEGIEFDGASGGAANVTIVNNYVSLAPTLTTAQAVIGIQDFGFGGNTFSAYFNTVYIGGTASGATPSWAMKRGTSAPTTYTARNNLLFNNRTGGTSSHFGGGDESANTGTFVSNNNFFAGTGATPANFMDYGTSSTGTPVSFAAWQAGPPTRDANSTGDIAANFVVNDIFVDVANNNLHLKSTAPASILNAGVPVAGVTTDFDGDPRDASTPDIGADELSPGVFSFSFATYTVGESAGNATITVNRVGADGAVSVNYSLSDGTATGGAACGGSVDYVNTGGTLNFANGQTSQNFNVQICADSLDRADETFNITLSGATGGATTGTPNPTVVTITDDDPTPSLSITDVAQSEGNAGTTNFTFNVNLSAASGQTVTVHYQTADGTATAPSDYTAIGDTTLTFNPGVTTLPVTVSVNGDTTPETNETFFVNLSNATNATISDTQGQGTINNDDVAVPGTLQFSSATYTVGEAGPTATITVTRTGGSDGAVTADYATVAGGSATGGAACGGAVDYVNTSGTVSFGNGVTTPQTFTVPICQDVAVESNETVNLALSNATGGATLGTPNTSVLTITDDDAAPTGNVVVNPGNVGYATLKEAFDAINAGTHTGAITIDITANTTETASAILNASGTGGANYTSVAIAPTGGARVVEGTIVGAVIKLNGADNVTIDGRIAGVGRNLTVRNNSIVTATAAIWLSSTGAGAGATNNVIRNLEIAAGATSNVNALTTIGILMNGATVSVTADGNDNDNNQFIANRITRARYGIVSRGVAANNNEGLVITDNIIGPSAFGADQIGKTGIFLQFDTGATVSRNTVQFVGGDFANTTAGADRCGICVGGESWGQTEAGALAGGDYTVTKNIVHDVVEERTFSSVGIRLGTTRSGVATNNLVANNFIYNVRANGTLGDQVAGIGYSGGHTDRIVFNSISLTGDMDPTGAANSTIYGNAMRVSTVNGTNNVNLTMMNNSIYVDVNSNTAANHYYAITLPAAAYVFGTGGLNFNNYYINQANPQLRTGALGTTSGNTPGGGEFQTLANWQAALTAPQDANSIQADPLYFSPTGNLHILGASPNVNTATPIAGITDDIDAQARPNGPNPDIGADEFYPAPGTVQFNSATYSVTEAAGTATITVTRDGGASGAISVDYATVAGGSATGGAACGGAVDYVNTSGTLNWADNDIAPKTFTVTVCNEGTFKGSETVNLALSNPTGGATLGTPSTAVLTIINSTVFSGTVNVGTGQIITSLTNPGGLFEQINNGGVSGNVTVNITSDLTAETGAVALNQFSGGFTLTIQPGSAMPPLAEGSGAARTISGSNATALITLNGADNVIINGINSGGNSLTIINTGAGAVVRLINDASNNTLQNSIIEAANTSATSAAVFLGTGTTTGNDNNTISGNIIRDRTTPTAGVSVNSIASMGSTGALVNSGNSITNNQITNFTGSGIQIGSGTIISNENWTINGNDISQTANRTTTVFGILVEVSLGTNTISQNTIHGLRSSVAAGTFISVGGMLLRDIRDATVSRNRIYDFPAVAAGTGRIIGIEYQGATGTPSAATVVNNMVSIVTSVATAQNVTGIFDFGFPGNTFNGYYNTVYIGGTSSGAASSWAINRGIDPTIHALRNNIAFNNRTGGTGNHFAAGDQAANLGTYSSDFNFFAGTGVTPANFMDYGTAGAGTPVSFPTWQAGPPARDANSIAGIASTFNPSDFFVDHNGGDLHLKATATVVLDEGTPVVGVTTDFDGQTRSATTPDLGADELIIVGPGTLALSSATYTVGESAGTVTITVNRSAGQTGAVSVNYSLSDGTATGGAACGGSVDYVNTGGTVNFADNETSKTFTVAICPDSLDRADETFNVTLSGATGGATIGMPSTAVVTITDDDPSPSITITDVTQVEGNAGTTNFTFNVNLSAASGQTVTVHYQTADGTATAPSDYTAIGDTTLTFNPGVTTLPVTVTVNGDTTFEPNETFFVNLSNATNATIGDNQGVGTITNDDAAPGMITINDVRVSEGDSGTSIATFTVTLTGGNPNTTSVNYATANGTATAGSDYQSASGTISFAMTAADNPEANPEGVVVVTRTISVTINGDIVKEPNETYFVNLSGATGGAVISDSQGVGVIIDEDRAYVADFDRDRKSDYSVFRPGDGIWYVFQSTNGVPVFTQFGLNGDVPVPADYDGDGITDRAVWRPSDGVWYIFQSSDASFQYRAWGLAGDKPVQGDYNGDGKADVAVFRPSDGVWYILQYPTGPVSGIQFGISTDRPVQGDYDGDGKTDLAVFRSGTYFIRRSSDNTVAIQSFGVASDKLVSGDFDGDGRIDLAIYRNGVWWITQSLTGNVRTVSWGLTNDIPVPADYDGDGTSDIAVFRPSDGVWYVLRSSNNGLQTINWGTSGDIPVPSAYLPQ